MNSRQQAENTTPLQIELRLSLVQRYHLPIQQVIVDHQLNLLKITMRFRQLILKEIMQLDKDHLKIQEDHLSLLRLKIQSYLLLYFLKIQVGKHIQNDHSHMTRYQLWHLDYNLMRTYRYNRISQKHKNHHLQLQMNYNQKLMDRYNQKYHKYKNHHLKQHLHYSYQHQNRYNRIFQKYKYHHHHSRLDYN